MPVRRRRVFYLSGFDPNGPAHYHRLYREQAALQSQVSGQRIVVGPRRTTGESTASWQVEAGGIVGEVDETIATDFVFLRWDDIVRAHWSRTALGVLRDTLAAGALLVGSGALVRILRLSWPAFLALAAPLTLIASLVLGLPLIAWSLHTVGERLEQPLGGTLAAGAAVGALVAAARRLEGRLHMQWLMRSTRFHGRQAEGRTPELDTRLDRFAADLCRNAQAGDVDEILVVGHSSGAMMAVSVLARALAVAPWLAQQGPRVSLLTLGQCTPLLSSLPQARRFRDELAVLAAARGVDWVDFTAPADGCCFALCDPIEAAGLPAVREVDHPKLLSPRFATLFSPGSYARLRRDRFRLHFQYLMASELPGDYDYFAITAGALSLAERFAGHASVRDFTRFRRFGRRPAAH